MRRFLSLSFLFGALLMSAGLQEVSAGKPIFKVNPGVDDSAQEVIFYGEDRFDIFDELTFTVSDLQNPEGGVLKTETFTNRTMGSFELPKAGDEDVCLSVVAKLGDKEEQVFIWNTMARAEGEEMMTYTGCGDWEPDDFDAFWDRQKERLAKIDPDPIVTRVPARDTEGAILYRVELAVPEIDRIVCWYSVPRSILGEDGSVIKKAPAMMVMPGYGAEEPPLDRSASGMVCLSVNPRHHGPSKEFWTSPVEHMMYNIEDPENSYYTLAYLDCLQAANFLFSRPEVDIDKVAMEGGSQGGLFTFALSGLDDRFAAGCANVPAFSSIPDGARLGRLGHMKTYRGIMEKGGEYAENVKKTLGYTDGLSFVKRAKCPIQINMGGQDPVCPFPCGIVAYNAMPNGVEKEFNVFNDSLHEVPMAMRKANAEFMKKHMNLTELPSLPGAVMPVHQTDDTELHDWEKK
jgi:cephalosporin-C deacetylase-like acetyl esterase